MKKFGKLHESVYLRITIIFVLILMPLFVAVIGLYNNAVGSVQKSMGTLVQSHNDTYLQNLTNDIKRIEYLMYDMYYDENLLFLTVFPKSNDFYNRSKGILRLQQRMNTIKSSSKYIEDVKVFLCEDGLLITYSMISYTSPEIDRMASVFELYDRSPIVFGEDRLNMLGAYPVRYNADYSPSMFLVEIDFSNFELSKMLREINAFSEGGVLLFDNNSDFCIVAGLDAAFAKNIKTEIQSCHTAFVPGNMDFTSSDGQFIKFKTDNSTYNAVFTTSNYLGLTLVRLIPETQAFGQTNRFMVWLVVFIVTTLLIFLIFSFLLYRFIHRPLTALANAFGVIKTGNLDITIRNKYQNEFKYIYKDFNDMVKELRTYIELSYKNKIMAQNAELKQLQAQINPHFLYNSFFYIQKRIKFGDNENALLLAEQLGEYFQFITRNAEDDIPLSQEVYHARIYADIQAARFSNRITVNFEELPELFNYIMVPRLILQPIIENAFVHGLEELEENGLLTVWFEESGDTLLVKVEDNGKEFTDEELIAMRNKLNDDRLETEITGIINIHRRLKLKFGDSCGISFERGSHGGLLVIMRLLKTEPRKEESDDV